MVGTQQVVGNNYKLYATNTIKSLKQEASYT
jgi:hypothetical protein